MEHVDEYSGCSVELIFRDPQEGSAPVVLPGGSKERSRLDEATKHLRVSMASDGWMTTVCMMRSQLPAFFAWLYGGADGMDRAFSQRSMPGTSGNAADVVEVTGFWD